MGLVFLLGSCNRHHEVPFPFDEPEYPQPAARPFHFSAPAPAVWKDLSVSSFVPPLSKPLDLEKIPSRPFEIDGFYALPKASAESPLDWDHLPDTAFNLQSVPATVFNPEYTALGEPEIIPIRNPRVPANASEAILELSDIEGLPSKDVYAMLLAKDGGVWLGTSKNVSRLNGNFLEMYTTQEGIAYMMAEDTARQIWINGQTGLSVLNVKSRTIGHLDLGSGNSVLIEPSGIIWSGTFLNGLYALDPGKKELRHIVLKGNFSTDRITRIRQDHEGKIWMCTTTSGVLIFDKKGHLKHLSMKEGLASNTIIDIMEDRQHRIWLSGARGQFQSAVVDVVDPAEKKIIHFGFEQGLAGRVIYNSFQDSSGLFWLHPDSPGIYQLSPDLHKIKHIVKENGLVDNMATYFMEDAQQQVWVSGMSGISIFNRASPVIRHLRKGLGISDNEVWGFFKDRRERVWMGNRYGIDIFDPVNHKMSSLGKAKGLSHDREDQFAADRNGNIWLGGDGPGLDQIDTIHHRISHWGVEQGLTISSVSALYPDSDGRIWIGSYEGAVEVLDPARHRVSRLELPKETKDHLITNLFRTAAGKIIFSVGGYGIFSLSADDKYWQTAGQTEGLVSDQTTAIFQDSLGKIWVGHENNLDLISLKDSLVETFTRTEGMPGKGVYSIAAGGAEIYVGTDEGIAVFKSLDRKKANGKFDGYQIKTYGHNQGLSAVNFNQNAVVFNKDGSSFWGVSPVLTYLAPFSSEADSLIPHCHLTGISIINKLRHFSSREEIVKVLGETDSISISVQNKVFRVSSLPGDSGYLQEKKIRWDGIEGPFNLPVHLRLPASENYLSFHFDCPQVKDADQIRYSYLLQGIDKTWSTPTAAIVSDDYRNLPPGEYSFLVRSHILNGRWSEPAAFAFQILTPWYQTSWAWLLYIAGFLALIGLYVRFRSKRLTAENLRLEKTVSLRTRELSVSLDNLKSAQAQLIQSEKMASLGELTAGIAHEIQNPLNFVNNFSEVNAELIDEMNQELKSGNLLDASEIAADIKENMEKIIRHGKRADAIVKGMLQHSRVSITHKEPTDINALVDEYLRLSYHGLRAKDKTFNAELETSFDAAVGKINLVGQDIGRTFLNLFNNAFYSISEKKVTAGDGYKPKFSVSTKRAGDRIEIRVRDNGTGIPRKNIEKIFQPFFTTKPVGQGTGLGLSLSYDIIVKIHEGSLKVETKEGEFTEFIIELPA